MNHVVINRCQNPDQYSYALKKTITSLGEEKFKKIISGKKVLLKPNLCIDMPPEKAATTHPALIDALINIIKTYNPLDIVVGDGPGVGVKGDVFGKTGIRQVCEKHSVKLVNFNQDTGQKIDFPQGFRLKSAIITKHYFSADTVINLPVMKTHASLWITGAMKNMMGFLVNIEKHQVHFNGEAESVIDLTRMLKQNLVIMDGMLGMMGNGPIAGSPANAGLLLGSWNATAIDIVAARIMGFKVKNIPLFKLAIKSGLSSISPCISGILPKDINLIWKKPLVAKSRILSKLAMIIIDKFFYKAQKESSAVVDHEKCTLCKRCYNMCPYNAISLKDSRVFINKDLCCLCLCCTEVCTNFAITMRGSLPDSFSRINK